MKGEKSFRGNLWFLYHQGDEGQQYPIVLEKNHRYSHLAGKNGIS